MSNPDPYSKRNRMWLTEFIKKCVAVGAMPHSSRCQQCGRDKPLDTHHPNYYHPLVIVWLCRRCHKREHNPGWLSNIKQSKCNTKVLLRHASVGITRNANSGRLDYPPELFCSDAEKELQQNTDAQGMAGSVNLRGQLKRFEFLNNG